MGLRGLWVLIAILACSACNYYFTPYVDLVVHVPNGGETGNEVGAAISQFAQQRKLVAWRSDSSSSTPEENRKINEKTTHYVTGTRLGEGTDLVYFDAAPTCKVARVVERSPKWTSQSQAALVRLRAVLEAIPGVTVETGDKFDSENRSARSYIEYCPD